MNQCALRISLNYRWLYIKCVCLFSIEIQTAGRIRMKFGTEVVFEGERLLGGGSTQLTPPSPGYRVHKGGPGDLWSISHAFWQKLHKTKAAGHLQFSEGGSSKIWIWKDLGPVSFWSHGHSLWREVHKIKVVVYIPISYLVELDTPYPDPGVQGGSKRAEWGSGSSGVSNVLLSQHTLVICLYLRLNTIFKTSFESSWVMPGNPN